MVYIIKHFDTELLKFSADENSSEPNIEVLWINEEKKHLLPIDMEMNPDSIYRWIRHRTIPKNRANPANPSIIITVPFFLRS